MVRFQFGIAVQYKVSAPAEFIFNVHAARTPAQRVIAEHVWSSAPGEPVISREPHFGNRLMRIKATAGEMEVNYQATVDLDHHFADPQSLDEMPVEELPADLLMYLLPSRFCQSDRLGSVSSWEFANEPKGYERVDAICRWVRQRTRLVAENTAVVRTALDTLTEKEGSYRDFAHLAIALCRSLSIPARFVTGIDYRREESDHGHASTDFHAYIEAYLGDRWYVFDPVGMSPTTALLRIGTGRDAADVAFATAFGNVWCVAPTMWIRSIVDPAKGLAEPIATDSAVSTSEPIVNRRVGGRVAFDDLALDVSFPIPWANAVFAGSAAVGGRPRHGPT